MSIKLIAKLRADRDTVRDSIAPLLARMEAGEELTETEHTEINKARADASELDARIAELMEAETARLTSAERDQRFDSLTRPPEPGAALADPASAVPLGIGAQFTASDVYTDYLTRKGGTSGVHIVQFTLIKTIDANSKNLVGVTRVSDAPMPTRTTPLLDALGSEPVKGNAFDWIEWPLTAPDAGASVAEGAPKPEVAYPPVLRTGTLEKIAPHIPVTMEMLEDVERAQAIIEGALIDSVKQGAETRAAAELAAASLPTAEHETLLGAIRVGIAKVQQAGTVPTGVVLNPLDYAEIDIELLGRTLNGARANNLLWGLDSVIPAGAIPVGTAVVGDLRRGATTFYRKEVALRITDSHASEFTSNILRILAEQRVSTKVRRPEFLVECTATATP